MLINYAYPYFFLFAEKQHIVRIRDRPSANTMESHIPLIPIRKGKHRTHIICRTRVRAKEISADIKPLLSAVKKDEAYILKPARR